MEDNNKKGHFTRHTVRQTQIQIQQVSIPYAVAVGAGLVVPLIETTKWD